MPMGAAGSGLCDGEPWTAISLSSLVCVSKRGRRRRGGHLEIIFEQVDGSHARSSPTAGHERRAPNSSPKPSTIGTKINGEHAQPRVMRLVYGGCKSTKTLQDEVF